MKELITAQKDSKLVIGENTTLKNIKLKRATSVYVAKDCKSSLVEKLKIYEPLGVQLIQTEKSSEELAILLRKDFKIAVVAILL
ncbi:MAG: ribosomal L7Ae/L30e/S12e/Gadd45 family protein [Nanoarchaeota archaeon]